MSNNTFSICSTRKKEEEERRKKSRRVRRSYAPVEEHCCEYCCSVGREECANSERCCAFHCEARSPSPPLSCGQDCCPNCCPLTQRSSRSKKSQGTQISSMSGTQLRSAVSSQIKVQNMLRESIAQLTEYADKVLHEDFSARPLSKQLGLTEDPNEKEVFEKIQYFMNFGEDKSKPKHESRGTSNIAAHLDIKLELYKKPNKETQVELKEEPKSERKLQPRKEQKVEPRIHSTKEATKWEIKKEAKRESKNSKGEYKWEATYEDKWEPRLKPKEEPKRESKKSSKEESNGIIKKEVESQEKATAESKPNGIIKKEAIEESQEKGKEESKAKLEKEMASKKTLKQLEVQDQIHNKVVSPMINRVQRSYLNNMEEQLRLMSYLESLPSTLVSFLKDQAQ